MRPGLGDQIQPEKFVHATCELRMGLALLQSFQPEQNHYQRTPDQPVCARGSGAAG